MYGTYEKPHPWPAGAREGRKYSGSLPLFLLNSSGIFASSVAHNSSSISAMSNINEVVNEYLARLRELNCASISWADLNFPISYSVQSVKMLPAESDPGLASLTLRTSPSSSFGQLRLVHASKDVAEAVKAAVDKESGGLLVEEMNGVLLVSVAQEGDQKDVVGVIKV